MSAPQRPTPRTDGVDVGITGLSVTADSYRRMRTHAKDLERSLSEREEECERLRDALHGLLEQVDSLDDYTLTRDVEMYKAQACWDDAIRTAIDAFSAAEAGGARDRTTK